MNVGKCIWYWLILVHVVMWSGAERVEASTQVLATCDDCDSSQYVACAIQIGHHFGLANGSYVWMVDFVQEQTFKFELEVDSSGPIMDGSGLSSSSEPTITPVQVAPSAWEQDAVDKLIDWVNLILRPNGGGYSFTQCSQAPSSTSRDDIEVHHPWSRGAVVVHPISVPPDAPWTSAYDVIGNTSVGIQLAQLVLSDMPVTSFPGSLYNLANDLFHVMPINLTAVVRMEFPDGSMGIWDFNAYSARWEADFASFSDSDGNPIPLTPLDMTGRIYFFSGNSPGQDNVHRFFQRVQVFGIPVGDPDGFPTECRLEGDKFGCWSASGY